MIIDKKKLWIQILAIIGLVLAVELAHIYYTANYDKYSLSSFCSINDFIDCDGAARSKASQFLGIPLAYWGIFFYLTILFLTFVDKLKNIKIFNFLRVFEFPLAYISTLGSIAFFCSMILAGISLYGIHKLCILCVITYFIDFLIAIVASQGSIKNLIESFKTTFIDFIKGAKLYPKTCIILLLTAIGFLCYSKTTLNFVPHIKQSQSILKYRKIKYNPYRVNGNTLGNNNGNVVIELYSDYVCPLCYIHNIMLHQAAKEFSNIKVIHHNLPFDKECNPYITANVHPNACFMSKAAIAARNQNNYWGMSSLLYEKQPKNIKSVLKLAETLDLDQKKFLKDLDSKSTAAEIEKELKESAELDIDATPTMIINGEQIIGVKPYYELKEILIKHGAKRK